MCITFLGIEIDSVKLRLQEDKKELKWGGAAPRELHRPRHGRTETTAAYRA